MDEQLPLREATLDDLPVLVKHRRLMFIDMGRAEGKGPTVADLSRIGHGLRRSIYGGGCPRHTPAWEVDSPDGAAGGGVLSIMSRPPKPGDTTGRAGYLCNMYTAEAYRHRGVARGIVLAAIDLCRRRKVGCILLSASDTGRGVCESLGFRLRDTFMRFRIE